MKENINKVDGTIIMNIILFIMNIFCLISTLSIKKSISIDAKKKVFKKPVKREHKDVQIQTEEYEELISANSTKTGNINIPSNL